MGRYYYNFLLIACCYLVGSGYSIRLPFLSTKRKESYTPLIFFTSQKGQSPACDKMEEVVTEVEKELGVKVQRLNLSRDENAAVTLSLLTSKPPPFLYHRESLQVIDIPDAENEKDDAAAGGGKSGGGQDDDDEEKKSAKSTAAVASIDKERVRAWAKGRFLPPLGITMQELSAGEIAQQADMIEDMTLSPQAKSGKEAIKKRTAAGSSSGRRSK